MCNKTTNQQLKAVAIDSIYLTISLAQSRMWSYKLVDNVYFVAGS